MSIVIGILGILSGIYLALSGHVITGVGGILGGTAMTTTGYGVLRGLRRKIAGLTHV